MLTCFNDADSRLRYYACEALYNIVKVARGAVLPHFNVLFDGLSKVSPPRSGCSELLPRLLGLTLGALSAGCLSPEAGEQIGTCCQGCSLYVESDDTLLKWACICFPPHLY